MKPRKNKRKIYLLLFSMSLIIGISFLLSVFLCLRVSIVTDYFYHAFVKDPPRDIPSGNNIVSPADGTIMYVKEIKDNIIPDIVKEGVPVPMEKFIKDIPEAVIKEGYLIGIYMNVESVHITRAPISGEYVKQIVFNGPHMPMTKQENAIILNTMIPGLVTIKKLLGIEPFSIEKYGDYILKSARETSVFKDAKNTYVYVIRIADYWVGNILTWIQKGEKIEKGQKIGMITWGSQVDICFERSENMKILPKVGDYVYAGETILATY